MTTDQLRDRIAALFRHPPGTERLGDATPGEIADAVLSVLPAPALTVARQVLGTVTALPETEVPVDADLRDRIAAVLWPLTDWDGDECNAVAAAVAVLAVLPTSAPAEPCGSLSQPTYSGEIMRCVLPVGHPRQCQSTTEYPWVSWPSPTAKADLIMTEMHRLALSEALGLGTGAPWDAIRERAAELRRLADEAQQGDPR
ncbi:hypothetical protein [Streptomyces sp. B1I3]|uniref:hypothetical protein n=1 Tax=Streptomyces sp. B1I3 TaxID=3042264 RepID=UPI0027896F08|nr:hypothetical protein [Streptomyces sp. B1I3]MDQ0792032.1 hypothetical protein [Streptomyces sp. B1I3]